MTRKAKGSHPRQAPRIQQYPNPHPLLPVKAPTKKTKPFTPKESGESEHKKSHSSRKSEWESSSSIRTLHGLGKKRRDSSSSSDVSSESTLVFTDEEDEFKGRSIDSLLPDLEKKPAGKGKKNSQSRSKVKTSTRPKSRPSSKPVHQSRSELTLVSTDDDDEFEGLDLDTLLLELVRKPDVRRKRKSQSKKPDVKRKRKSQSTSRDPNKSAHTSKESQKMLPAIKRRKIERVSLKDEGKISSCSLSSDTEDDKAAGVKPLGLPSDLDDDKDMENKDTSTSPASPAVTPGAELVNGVSPSHKEKVWQVWDKADNGYFLGDLQILQARISTIRNREVLQYIADLMHTAGSLNMEDAEWTFDLCNVDKVYVDELLCLIQHAGDLYEFD